MKLLLNYDIALRIIVFISLLSGIAHKYANHTGLLGLHLLLWAVLVIVDLLRRLNFYLKQPWDVRMVNRSIGISFLLGTYFGLTLPIGITYFYMLPWDAILYLPNRKSLRWLVPIILTYITIWGIFNTDFGAIQTPEYWQTEWRSYLTMLFLLTALCLIPFYMKYQLQEKAKFQRMSAKLHAANAQLEEYANEIESLAIARERNRLAQEIHDSLGHSLAGLVMHLDFIEKVIDSNPGQAKDLAVKAQNMARQGMQEVRQAVLALREDSFSHCFRDSLHTLVNNLQVENGLQIDLIITEEVETLPIAWKSLIFRNIKEGLTNSIKHGHSKQITIQLQVNRDVLHCELTDDGQGAESVEKHNGLHGMETRLAQVGGSIYWQSQLGQGFTLIFTIPLKGVYTYHDKNKSTNCR